MSVKRCEYCGDTEEPLYEIPGDSPTNPDWACHDDHLLFLGIPEDY